MSKSFGKWLMEFQLWVISHVNQLYLWVVVFGALSTGLYLYRSSHHLPAIHHLAILIFVSYASWKIIVR